MTAAGSADRDGARSALESAEAPAVSNATGADHAETSARTFRLVLYDALASEAMGTLTAGVFLVGFAVELGASNSAIGLLASVPFFVQLLQLPAVVVVERVRARRAICVWTSGIGRGFLLAAAFAPLVAASAGIGALIALLAVHQGMAAVSGCSWNSWMRDLVPESEQGRFFGRRTAAATALATVLVLLGGGFVELWKVYIPASPVIGYSLLFALSAAIGLFGVYLLSITPDRPMPPVVRHVHPLHLIWGPFRDANFRRLVTFLASWSFAVNLAAPFFAVYMLKTLGYPMTTITALTTASQLSNLAALGPWGRLIDRFSNKGVLAVCAPLFLGCMFAWTLTGLRWVEPVAVYALFGIHILMGISTAGMALASGNLAMKLSPRGEATAYLAANSVVTSVCGAIAPVIGGLTADFFAAHQLSFSFTWSGGPEEVTVQVLRFHGWTFFFVIASFLGLYSLHRMAMIEEGSGEADRLLVREFLLEARRSMHSLSTAAGLLRIARAPFSFVRTAASRERPEKGC
jgi:MFS family permease